MLKPTNDSTDSNFDFFEKVTTVILAGGQGTRLFPLTQKRCKPAVAFGSHYRLIDIPISNSLNSGIREIAVISQHFASELNNHITSTYHLDQFQKGQFKLLCPEESSTNSIRFRGTADAVRQNLHYLLTSSTEYFLILSGDQLYNIDFRSMLQFAKDNQADLVIASLRVKEEEARRMGLLKIDAHSSVIDFYEKPSEKHILERFQLSKTTNSSQEAHYLGSMGIYVFTKSALVSILKEQGDDFGKEIIPLQCKKGGTFSFVYDGYWEDIGTIASYYQANLALTKREACLDMYNEKHPIYANVPHLPSATVNKSHIEHSILGQGSVIHAEELTHSIVGIRVTVGVGTIIRDSFLLGGSLPTHIGAHCTIEHAIIDENVSIGNNVRLINKEHLKTFDGDGIFVRDGIIIVTSGTNLPNGFIF